MRTAVDTSVLYAIYNREPGSKLWLDLLVKARSEGQLVVCEVAYAEFSPSFTTQTALDAALDDLGILFDQIQPEAAFLAGQIFFKYRREGGPRKQMIPDFLVAAHAKIQASQLATMDAGFARKYFNDLPILTP